MDKTAQKISVQDAQKLLSEEESISVVIQQPTGSARPELWSRVRVLAFMQMHGVCLAGPQAREINHGIATLGPDGNQYLFETKHT